MFLQRGGQDSSSYRFDAARKLDPSYNELIANPDHYVEAGHLIATYMDTLYNDYRRISQVKLSH